MDIFSHLFVVKIAMFVWKDKKNEKEAGDCPFFIKNFNDISPFWLQPFWVKLFFGEKVNYVKAFGLLWDPNWTSFA